MTALDIGYVGVFLFFLAFGYLAGYVVGRLRESARDRQDAVLVIKPPRRFVDPDGRSDFRPEFREAAEKARLAALRDMRRDS